MILPRVDSPANRGGSDGAKVPNFEHQSPKTTLSGEALEALGDNLYVRASDSMSGVEVIGLVLAVLPLVISAAEDYKKCFEPLDRWRRFKFVFRDFITSVDIQRQMFQLVLKKLLIRVQLPAEEKQRLLTVANYEGWSEPETVDAIRSRLGESYDACMEILRVMKEDMQELQVMMSLKDGSVCCPYPWLASKLCRQG
jgi:hypothetical protein